MTILCQAFIFPERGVSAARSSMMRSRRTAAYSYSIIRAAAFISFSKRAISRSLDARHLNAVCALGLALGLRDLDQLAHVLDDGFRHDAVRTVIRILNRAAALRLVDGRAHGGRDLIGVHDNASPGVSRGAADRLDQARLTAQEALLVRIEDRHQRDLGQIQAPRAAG